MGITAKEEDYKNLQHLLTSTEVPLAKRFRALFTLRAIADERAIDIIGQAFADKSALLGHELAYVLGQIQNPKALPILEKVLSDVDHHPMVRHEAAEAMGAIGDSSSIKILTKYRDDVKENKAVRETCEIALDKLKHDEQKKQKGEKEEDNKYLCIDPAPPMSMHDSPTTSLSTEALRTNLLDTEASLFQRYRAMFALRNQGTKEAVLALADGFQDSSALFRHEIAYVFGQMCSPHSIPALKVVLENESEDEMVRHEAAEALGSIASDDVMPILKKYQDKGPLVVRQSCVVALDMAAHEASGEFEYAVPIANVA